MPFNGAMDPVSLSEECIPPFLNHMLVNAATPQNEGRAQATGSELNVSEYTYFEVYSYSVDFSDKDDAPQFNVRISTGLPVVRGRHIVINKDAPAGEVRLKEIPGSEKFSFKMDIDGWFGKNYFNTFVLSPHPPKDVEVKEYSYSTMAIVIHVRTWENYSKTTPLADKYGLILITACGSWYGWYSSFLKSTSGWNAGVCCVKRDDIDDVNYTRIILERENKNNLPVYGYGYSNGGMMVESLLCHKVIQMAVSVNGVLALKPGLNGAFKTCDDIYNNATFGPKPPVPRVASIHCLDDEWVPLQWFTSYGKKYKKYFSSDLLPRTNRDIGTMGQQNLDVKGR
ncbi:hypothetical protein FOZ60_003821 [Perkinsus olseni]|uniref:Uncharacterized protein n=1 Tax=Perkinsus olseni TaxID=32597 RepID=A0A7J6NVE1_PEROL|nr:hypothetical protein FOZ60_003821 [Perkinsus olseni]